MPPTNETIDGLINTIEKMAEALARERGERARLAAAVGTMFDGVEARLAKLELGRSGVPALTAAEQGMMKARLRQALAVSLDELAEQRLAAAPTGPRAAANMPRLGGEAHGTVITHGD